MRAHLIPRTPKLLVLALIALAGTHPSPAQPASQIGAAFPVIGLAPGQTARVSALNLPTPVSTVTSGCAVTLRFVRFDGTVISESTVTVRSSQAGSLDLPHRKTGAASRVGLRVELLFGSPSGVAPGPETREQFDCNILPSLEIFDQSTGRTNVVVTDWKPILGADPRSIAKSRRQFP